MASNILLNRYIWLLDTIKRCHRISRRDLSERWQSSPVSDGRPLARRTFYNYRLAIEELFCVEVKFDSTTKEYYIESDDSHSESMTNWLLNSAAMSGVLSDSREVSSRIFLEEVPPAREHLATIIDAIKNPHVLKFSYHPYSRTNPTPGVLLEPYLLKIFRQRWYVTGRNVTEKKIKTYALDRISSVEILPQRFDFPADFDPEEYFSHSFGIVVDNSEPRHVTIKSDARQAKYLRALPLHPSQQEMLHDNFSIFHYKIRITEDFMQELLSLGPRITVLTPPELRAMMINSLRQTLNLYDNNAPTDNKK